MGLRVRNQVDNRRFFCLTSISKKMMKHYGINLPVKQFKELVKETKPYTRILTGNDNNLEQRRMTNIYRYEDFVIFKRKIE